MLVAMWKSEKDVDVSLRRLFRFINKPFRRFSETFIDQH